MYHISISVLEDEVDANHQDEDIVFHVEYFLQGILIISFPGCLSNEIRVRNCLWTSSGRPVCKDLIDYVVKDLFRLPVCSHSPGLLIGINILQHGFCTKILKLIGKCWHGLERKRQPLIIWAVSVLMIIVAMYCYLIGGGNAIRVFRSLNLVIILHK